MRNLFNEIRNFAKQGLFHIFGSSVLAQVCALISSMVVVRNLPKEAYGYYVSANNVYSYVAVFVGLGMASAVLQYCSENTTEQRKNAIHRFALSSGNIANILLFIVIVFLAGLKYWSGEPDVAGYLLAMSLLPFATYINNYLQLVLRVTFNNKGFSYVNMVYAVALLGSNIVFTLLFGVIGLILATYISNLIAAVLCVFYLKKDSFFGELKKIDYKLESIEKREIRSYAIICAITSFTSTVLVLLDITCLDIVLKDPTVLADYKVAATIPSACVFVPSCLMTFFYPKLVQVFSTSVSEGKKMLFKLTKFSAAINFVVFICLVLLAPLIVRIIFGEKYMNVVPIFRILSINYFVYCFRHLFGNVIAVLKKVKMNLLFSILAGCVNIVLNILLIQIFASYGAAFATLFVSVFVGVLEVLFLKKYLKGKEKLA